MPELAVDPAALLDVAESLGQVADRLAALSAALPRPEAAVGSVDLVHALENAVHTWQNAVRGAAIAVGAQRDQLVAAASTYEGVEALVSDWSAP